MARQLLEGERWKGDVTAPFFGFMGAAAALVFACKLSAFATHCPQVSRGFVSHLGYAIICGYLLRFDL